MTRARHPIPLRHSIPASLALVSLVLMAIALAQEWTIASSEVEDGARRAATTLGEVTTQTLERDASSGAAVFAALKVIPNLTLAIASDDAGTTFLSTDLSLHGRQLTETTPAAAALLVASARSSLAGQTAVSPDGAVLWGAFPFHIPGDAASPRTGVLFTQTDLLGPMEAERLALANRATFMGSTALLLCLSAWLYLNRTVTRRAASLVGAARELAAGHLGTAALLSGSDELADVAASLNKMASDLRAQQAALQESQERLAFALQTSRIGAWELDLEKHTGHRTPFYDRIFGYQTPHPAWTWEEFLQHVVPEDRAAVDLSFRQAAAARSEWSLECRIRRADGETRWIAVAGGHVHAPHSRAPSRMAGIVQDITERKRGETERSSLEDQLRQSQKMEAIGTLAGGIAHDFNNLLQAILGNVELARLGTHQPTQQRDSLDEIRKAATRAQDLVRRILAFSRREEPEQRTIQLRPIVEEAAKLLRATVPAGVELRVVLPDELPFVRADPSQVHQVVMNLATNAWQALEGRGGFLELSLGLVQVDSRLSRLNAQLRRGGNYARLSVSDSGRGMDAATLQRIFDPFFTTKAPGVGTGLGLSVVQGIVRNHGGAITVESEPGRGTTFHVYFPVRPADAAEPPAAHAVAPEPEADPDAGSHHILYLDDEEALVSVARKTLEAGGYRFSGFETASEALAAFIAHPDDFALVVTDFNMPGLDGMELARRVLELRPRMPVVLTSGYLREEEEAQARAAGVRAVLHKPAMAGELRALVRRLLAPDSARGA